MPQVHKRHKEVLRTLVKQLYGGDADTRAVCCMAIHNLAVFNVKHKVLAMSSQRPQAGLTGWLTG